MKRESREDSESMSPAQQKRRGSRREVAKQKQHEEKRKQLEEEEDKRHQQQQQQASWELPSFDVEEHMLDNVDDPDDDNHDDNLFDSISDHDDNHDVTNTAVATIGQDLERDKDACQEAVLGPATALSTGRMMKSLSPHADDEHVRRNSAASPGGRTRRRSACLAATASIGFDVGHGGEDGNDTFEDDFDDDDNEKDEDLHDDLNCCDDEDEEDFDYEDDDDDDDHHFLRRGVQSENNNTKKHHTGDDLNEHHCQRSYCIGESSRGVDEKNMHGATALQGANKRRRSSSCDGSNDRYCRSPLPEEMLVGSYIDSSGYSYFGGSSAGGGGGSAVGGRGDLGSADRGDRPMNAHFVVAASGDSSCGLPRHVSPEQSSSETLKVIKLPDLYQLQLEYKRSIKKLARSMKRSDATRNIVKRQRLSTIQRQQQQQRYQRGGSTQRGTGSLGGLASSCRRNSSIGSSDYENNTKLGIAGCSWDHDFFVSERCLRLEECRRKMFRLLSHHEAV